MTNGMRALLRGTVISLVGLAAAFAPAKAFAKTTLQVVRGSGEFQTIETSITVTKPESLTMQWSTDQAGAAGGTWQVTNVTNRTKVPVASGETPAPPPGKITRFTIPANAFLQPAPPAAMVKFSITITPHNAAKQPLGSASAPVVVSQVPESKQPPVTFGDSAVFPSVVLVSYDEKIGMVPQTQLRYAGADVTVRLSNKGQTDTAPLFLGVNDNALLLRQSTPKASVPGLKPGQSHTVTVHMNAILPPPKSQLGQEQQFKEWNQQYSDRCGVELRAVMDWRGPQAQTPMNPHMEARLVEEGWVDYAKVGANSPICDSTQCVNPCQIAKNIRKELDGHAVGYAFFAGQYPRFGSYGQARTASDGARNFTRSTKVTVASVSKLVTAIAAVRILDKNNVSLDAGIGPYLPADWSPSNYVKNITFAQLLSHTSGIKDYGNVDQGYAGLKTFFTQSVNNSATTTCQPSSVQNPSDPINPNSLSGCYSNWNFSIFRVLLPKVAGLAEDANQATRPQTLANQYEKLVQQNVFDRVGQPGVACRPPASATHAFAYNHPGNHKGKDWGDVSLQCGCAGWYLSVQDMAKVLLSISAKDGKILTETASKQRFDTMRTRKLGWDVANNNEVEKNGGWGAGCDGNGNYCGTITTTAAVFGPVTGPRVVGVLFINSDVSGAPGGSKSAKAVLEKAYNDALYPKP